MNDTRDDDNDEAALGTLIRLKYMADFHINSLRSFTTNDVRREVSVKVDDDWQDHDDWIEERLDRLRGGDRMEHETAWWLFTTQSAYSPMRLQTELGWQPTPRGLPSHCDPSLFGWVDAFEDLLAVSSATPMMSFERRETMNKVMQPLLVLDGGPSHWFLWNRVQWQGLNEVYFPVYMPQIRYRSPRSMEEWAAVRRHTPVACHNWEHAVMDLMRDISDFGGIDLLRFLLDTPDKAQLTEGQPTLESVIKLFTALQKMSAPKQSEAAGDDFPSKKPDSPRPLPTSDAETEEDLYLASNSQSDNTPDVRKTEHKTADGGSETVVEKSEAIPDGRISIISIEKKDKYGRVISSEFHASINQPPFSSPFWRKFWENARPHDGSGGSRGEDSE